ncbi:coproporphyrinogen III oxidase [Arcanobacterium buesumense]|uniref:Heme chaperone HemW n=1 Tax=Arcanobacterium buesumense TaxID=2722751 RepID=A0A6H2ENP0_9ACTO|nr:coproporphyrinogen III oxidase [Arcanobacterium buesumense]
MAVIEVSPKPAHELSLPDSDVSDGFGAYVHIPFCRVRCGYCDFNTYTNTDFGSGASVGDYHESLMREIEISARYLTEHENGAGLTSVFFGGGTPTMLNASQLVAVLDRLREQFGVVDDAEITTEANPETVDRQALQILKDGGFNRVSFGMQSAVPHVLATLERQHSPGQVTKVAQWAREVGLEYSVDLIYGAPGESLADWQRSLDAAIALEPGHISAYGLTIEPGTAMGRQVRRGELPDTDPDEQAAKYEIAEAMLTGAGYSWYEVSNWAKPGKHSRHNMAYWRNTNWWGYGPGAHSHINGTRFWNVKHPGAYAQHLLAGNLPIADVEHLTDTEQREEAIMLGVRLAEGIAIPDGTQPRVIAGLIADELVDPAAALSGRIVLTLRGRLLADTVIRALW